MKVNMIYLYDNRRAFLVVTKKGFDERSKIRVCVERVDDLAIAFLPKLLLWECGDIKILLNLDDGVDNDAL